jgi:hypothetical protein
LEGGNMSVELSDLQRRFRESAEQGAQYRTASDRENINYVLFMAGSQWGKPATPEEILSALDAAGFEIVRKSVDG